MEPGKTHVCLNGKRFILMDKDDMDYNKILDKKISNVDLDNLDNHYIDKDMVVPVLERMLEERNFSDKYLYDYICDHWCRIENGYDLETLAEYLCCYKSYDDYKTLKKRLKKQIDDKGYITIYRGFNDYSREDGNSYTLSLDKAIWFSRRFAEEVSYVNTYKIHIYDVLAFITDRNEAEIVAMPDDVILLETIKTKNDFCAKA